MIRLFLRKIIISLIPLILLYLLQKKRDKTTPKKSIFSDFDKNKVVEGEILKERK